MAEGMNGSGSLSHDLHGKRALVTGAGPRPGLRDREAVRGARRQGGAVRHRRRRGAARSGGARRRGDRPALRRDEGRRRAGRGRRGRWTRSAASTSSSTTRASRSASRSLEHTEEEFDGLMAINVKGVFLGIKYAMPALAAGGGGTIINMSSVAGLGGVPLLGAYCASKAARHPAHADGGDRAARRGHPRQRGLPVVHRHRDGRAARQPVRGRHGREVRRRRPAAARAASAPPRRSPR